MCKYCHFEPNGDMPEDSEFILNEEIDLSMTIEDSPEAVVKFKPKIGIDARVWHDSNKDEWSLCVGIFDGYDPPLFDSQYHFVEGKINFCPMCGRKL